MNGDGQMDLNEFSVACKLINLKLKGFEVPSVLPPSIMVIPQMAMSMAPVSSMAMAPVSSMAMHQQPMMAPMSAAGRKKKTKLFRLSL